MKANQTYLSGRSVFTVSLFVVGLTVLTVYLSGIGYQRTITSNFYLSLSVIAAALFLFLSYGLYTGISLVDNFPTFRKFRPGDIISSTGQTPGFPGIDTDDGISGLLLSVVLWILATIMAFVFLLLLEVVFWASLFIILAMLYWVFFRALRVVFSKSGEAMGRLGASVIYSLAYTTLYVGWMFGVVFVAQLWR